MKLFEEVILILDDKNKFPLQKYDSYPYNFFEHVK